MEKLNIIVCGCTKNSDNHIENEIDSILNLKQLFLLLDIVIYENDSTDNTLHILKSLEQKKKINLISEVGIHTKLKNRTVIMAHGRNKLIEFVNSKNKYDYMIMLDLDNVMTDFDHQGLIDAFSYNMDTWDVLTGNCKNIYYDIWALRLNKNKWTNDHNKIWNKCIDYDCWDMIQHKSQEGLNEWLLHIKPFQKHINKYSKLLEVDSSFGGIGIYKVSKIKNCKYSGFTSFCSCNKYNILQGPCSLYTCEHISFHNDMIEKHNAKIFICPQLIIKDQPEHLV
tara:strand:+ start:138 stop:983 length:846 start_codon:yes stop_codon:yes gene_type:complete